VCIRDKKEDLHAVELFQPNLIFNSLEALAGGKGPFPYRYTAYDLQVHSLRFVQATHGGPVLPQVRGWHPLF